MRPYFLAVCKPNITAKDCLNEFGTQKFVENYVCKEKDDHILKEAVKSFFSGHAAYNSAVTIINNETSARVGGRLM